MDDLINRFNELYKNYVDLNSKLSSLKKKDHASICKKIDKIQIDMFEVAIQITKLTS